MSTEPQQSTDQILPIYQGLLNELDPASRATIVEQQGEGIIEVAAEDAPPADLAAGGEAL